MNRCNSTLIFILGICNKRFRRMKSFSPSDRRWAHIYFWGYIYLIDEMIVNLHKSV